MNEKSIVSVLTSRSIWRLKHTQVMDDNSHSVSVCGFVFLTTSRRWADTEPLTVTLPPPPASPSPLLGSWTEGSEVTGQVEAASPGSEALWGECSGECNLWPVQEGWGRWRNVGINGAAWNKEEVKTGANSPFCHLFVQLTLVSSPPEKRFHD